MSAPADGVELPPLWRAWVQKLQAVLTEGLLPLFWLHCRRGQSSVPVASLAASLDAAGGPLPGAAAASVVSQIAAACPDFVLVQHSGSELASITLKVAALEQVAAREKASKVGQGAMCAGVVSKGFSLALPQADPLEPGQRPRDAQGKRWRNAQGSFYVNIEAVEREIARRKPQIFKQIARYAELHQAEDPPSLVGCTSEVSACKDIKREVPEGEPEVAAATQQLDAQPDRQKRSVLALLAELEQHPKYRQQICHVENYSARPARYLPFDDLVDAAGRPLISEPSIATLRNQFGVEQLFAHQHSALSAVLGRRQHLCLTTGTSSGKSLAFALPILEDFRRDPNLRALIIFPTKALAQDQLGKLERLFHAVCPGLGVCTFDGDTPKTERASRLKNCHVFLTNPDMLHFTILANHRSWRNILENLRYVVLDEAHVYRATFGSHVALLLRRFRRVLHYYGSAPLFIACSATIQNAAPFFVQLVGLQRETDVFVVDNDTAGRGDRKFCLWNPPLLELSPEGHGKSREELNARKRSRHSEREGNSASPKLPPGVGYKTRSSAYDEAAWILAEALRRSYRVVCFLQVRSMVELVLQSANEHLEGSPELQARLAAYRGGYSATDRRRLEQRLFTGDLLGVVATNALELGIDIGDLDVTIHVGLPPTVASVWQQAGRAGRRGRPSVAVLVAHDAPLEQHFCRYPAEFFQRSLEARLPDVNNNFLLRGHALCAAVELAPLSIQEAGSWFGSAVLPVLQDCKREGRLIVHLERHRAKTAAQTADDGDEKLMHCQYRGRKAPKEEVSLRDIDPVQFQVLVRGDSSPLETLEQKLAFMKLHPGAVYLHQQRAYFVEELDLQARTAWVVPRDPKRIDYYTECREHSQVVLSGGGISRDAVLPASPARSLIKCGGVTHRWCMYGFRKLAKADRRILDQIDLSLPAVEYPTQAVWMDLPGCVLQPVAQAGHAVDRGGLHALEHAMISLAPLCCDLEASDLTCQHTRRDSDPNRYLLLLLETQKGGSGCVSKVYEKFETLLQRAVQLLEECPCDEGCPNCIVAPRCGEYNHGLDKTAAIMIGRALGLHKQRERCTQFVGSRDRSRSRDCCRSGSRSPHNERSHGSDLGDRGDIRIQYMDSRERSRSRDRTRSHESSRSPDRSLCTNKSRSLQPCPAGVASEETYPRIKVEPKPKIKVEPEQDRTQDPHEDLGKQTGESHQVRAFGKRLKAASRVHICLELD